MVGFVLGGRRRRHNCGVNESVLAHEEALFGKAGIDLLEDPLVFPAHGESEDKVASGTLSRQG